MPNVHVQVINMFFYNDSLHLYCLYSWPYWIHKNLTSNNSQLSTFKLMKINTSQQGPTNPNQAFDSVSTRNWPTDSWPALIHGVRGWSVLLCNVLTGTLNLKEEDKPNQLIVLSFNSWIQVISYNKPPPDSCSALMCGVRGWLPSPSAALLHWCSTWTNKLHQSSWMSWVQLTLNFYNCSLLICYSVYHVKQTCCAREGCSGNRTGVANTVCTTATKLLSKLCYSNVALISVGVWLFFN